MDSNLDLQTDSARFDLDSETGSLSQSDYRYLPMHARGNADSVEREGGGITLLHDATYTTCNPGREDWLLSAGRVRLDENEGEGTARNVWLRFKHVPFFYTPWISFPIDDRRKSGFSPPPSVRLRVPAWTSRCRIT